MIKLVSIFFLIFLCFNTCLCQPQKHVYKYEYNTQLAGIKKQFYLHYWVDSAVSYTYNNLIFYKFTFSKDSLENSGFISFNKKNGDVFYLSDTVKGKANKIQKIFTRSKRFVKGIKAFPFIEHNVDLFYQIKANVITFKVKYKYPLDSHSIYIAGFEFKKNENYPTAIVFFFPFEDKKFVTLHPSSFP